MLEPLTDLNVCRYPFLDCPGCDRCAVPTYTLPPEIPALQSKLTMLGAIWLMFAIIGIAAFTIPHNFNSVVTAHAEDVR